MIVYIIFINCEICMQFKLIFYTFLWQHMCNYTGTIVLSLYKSCYLIMLYYWSITENGSSNSQDSSYRCTSSEESDSETDGKQENIVY